MVCNNDGTFSSSYVKHRGAVTSFVHATYIASMKSRSCPKISHTNSENTRTCNCSLSKNWALNECDLELLDDSTSTGIIIMLTENLILLLLTCRHGQDSTYYSNAVAFVIHSGCKAPFTAFLFCETYETTQKYLCIVHGLKFETDIPSCYVPSCQDTPGSVRDLLIASSCVQNQEGE